MNAYQNCIKWDLQPGSQSQSDISDRAECKSVFKRTAADQTLTNQQLWSQVVFFRTHKAAQTVQLFQQVQSIINNCFQSTQVELSHPLQKDRIIQAKQSETSQLSSLPGPSVCVGFWTEVQQLSYANAQLMHLNEASAA